MNRVDNQSAEHLSLCPADIGSEMVLKLYRMDTPGMLILPVAKKIQGKPKILIGISVKAL